MTPAWSQRSNALQSYENVARTVMCGFGSEIRSTTQPNDLEMKVARKNSVGLEFITHYPVATEFLKQERERYDAFTGLMQEISALLGSNQIEHMFIKFRKLYQYYDSNIDVIVNNRQWDQTIALLRSEGFSGHVMFKEPDKIMFSKPDLPVSVHLHPGVTWNGVPYFDHQSLWRHSTRSTDGPWLELDKEYDFLVNLAHNVFENYDVILGDVLYFKRFMESYSFDPFELERIASENGWRYGFQQAYAQIRLLVESWADVGRSGNVPTHLLAYPYRISMIVLVRAFGQRIMNNIAGKRFHTALREVYAYPAFYALKRRHDFL